MNKIQVTIPGNIWRSRDYKGDPEYLFKEDWQDLQSMYVLVQPHTIELTIEVDEDATIAAEVAIVDEKIRKVQLAAHEKLEELRAERANLLALTHTPATSE